MDEEVEGTESGSTEEVQVTPPDQGNNSGPNPAWNDVLSLIPEQLHGAVTQHFTKWDQAANSKIEAANAKVKEFEAYQPFVEHGIGFEDLSQGLNLLHTVNNNPQALYDALRETYNLTDAEAKEVIEEVSEEVADETTLNPKLQQLEEGLNVLAQHFLTEQQAKEAAQADTFVKSEFAKAKEKYGEFDEGWVTDRMLARGNDDNYYSVDQAVQDYQGLVQNIIAANPRPFAPRVLGGTSGGGSGLPSQAVDVTKLDDKEAKALVVEMLRQQAQQT